MKKLIFVVIFLVRITLLSEEVMAQDASFGTSKKLHFLLQTSYNAITLNNVSFNETGLKPTAGFFPMADLSVHIGYFSVVNMDGSSNLNGIDFGMRYFFYGAGTETSLSDDHMTVIGRPKFSFYGGVEFQTKDLKFNTSNLDFSGWAFSVGVNWHRKKNYFINGEINYASLQNALGSSTVQKLSITSLIVGIGTMF